MLLTTTSNIFVEKINPFSHKHLCIGIIIWGGGGGAIHYNDSNNGSNTNKVKTDNFQVIIFRRYAKRQDGNTFMHNRTYTTALPMGAVFSYDAVLVLRVDLPITYKNESQVSVMNEQSVSLTIFIENIC